jgi:hypothetical protein
MRISDWRSAGYNVVLGRRQLDGLERHQVEAARFPITKAGNDAMAAAAA